MLDFDKKEGESLRDWLTRLDFTSCNDCSISHDMRLRRHVSPRGDVSSPIVFVGEAPGDREEADGEAFVGPAGQKLVEIFESAGVDTQSCYITNTVKCRPLKNRTPTSEECKKCREKFLKHEILSHPRKLVVALGNIGYFGVVPKGTPTGITSRCGAVEYNEEFSCYVLPCLHPAAVLRNPSSEPLIEDVAVKVAKFIEDGFVLPVQSATTYKEIRNLATFEEFIWEVEEAAQLAVDLETSSFDYSTGKILCIVFSTKSQTSWYLPIIEEEDTAWTRWDWSAIQEGLRKIFEDESIRKVGHNIKFDLKFLIYNFGWNIKGELHDTMLMHHLLDENTPHGLKELALKHTDMGNYAKELEDSFKVIKRSRVPVPDKNYGKIPLEILKEYALRDADATIRLYDLFRKELEEQDLYSLYRNVVMEVLPALMQMEMTGIKVDLQRVEELKVEFENRIQELLAEIGKYSPKEINVRSALQLRELLYYELSLPILKTTEKGEPSTDEETLTLLKAQTKHPIADLLLEFRKVSKLYTTYIMGIKGNLGVDGRIHTSYQQHGTKTGRLASKEPNLQQVPRESSIRTLFVPTEGWYLVVADFKQSELRSWCHYSRDEKFLEALVSSDVHSTIGSELLGKPPEEITEDERTRVKMAVFGVAYGRGANSLSDEWGMSRQEAQTFIDKFFEMYPVSAKWLLSQEEHVKKHKFVKSMFGRVRRLPEVDSSDMGVSAQALRQSRNAVIQATSSDITNLSLVHVRNKLKSLKMTSRLLLQVHDSVVLEACPEEVEQAVRILEECMTKPPPGFTVPLAVKIEVSDRWGGKPIPLGNLAGHINTTENEERGL